MTETNTSADGRRRPRILLAEDEEFVRQTLRLILARQGYEIEQASDGEEAVHKCLRAEEPFDLLVLDMNMPRLDGLAALRQIWSQKPETRAILLSGTNPPQESGNAVFLQKPFNNQDLIRTVEQMIQQG